MSNELDPAVRARLETLASWPNKDHAIARIADIRAALAALDAQAARIAALEAERTAQLTVDLWRRYEYP